MMSSIRRIAAGIIGFVLCLGAVFKLMDPVGTALIVESYFKFAGLSPDLGICKILGESLSLVEAFLGIALISGVFRFVVSIAVSALLLFFTAVTAVLLVKNPQMDCGCFGEVVHLTHLQSFVKNLILDALAVLSFVPLRRSMYKVRPRYGAFVVAAILILSFAVVSWVQVPLAEFTPYRISNTVIDENSHEAVFDDGQDYPFLPLSDASGANRSADALQGKVALVSVYDPENADILEIASFCQSAINAGFFPFVVSRSPIDVPGVECLLADYKVIITLNRSNGGSTFLSDGLIIHKRSSFRRPTFEQMEEMALEEPARVYISGARFRSLALQSFALCFLFALLIL